MTDPSLAAHIDHTLLQPEATWLQVERIVDEALQFGFAGVCVHGCYVAQVARRLAAGRGQVKACAVVGFPLGAGLPNVKAFEATMAVRDGAEEIDFVAHLPALLAQDVEAARWEFMAVVQAARAQAPGTVVKVILETAVLLHGVSADQGEARIAAGCLAARESGCDFVKTSTGFHSAGGASVEAVTLLRRHGQGMSVKASGGIRTRQDALKMLAAGADRLGCSAGVAIMAQDLAASAGE